MLFKILKLFGLDVPAKIAAARTEFGHRVEDAADCAKQATLTAALMAAFSAVAAFLFIVAVGVGLFALYRVIAEYYGVYAGLGAVAGLLIAAASVLLLAARTRAQSLLELRFVRRSSPLPPARDVVAQASPSVVPPENEAFSANESAADVFEPLALAFAKYVRFPTLGNPVLDQFVGGLKASAQGTADDAVRRAANLIRHGDRTQLVAIIGVRRLWDGCSRDKTARHHCGTLHLQAEAGTLSICNDGLRVPSGK
jgi:hypothetical protein